MGYFDPRQSQIVNMGRPQGQNLSGAQDGRFGADQVVMAVLGQNSGEAGYRGQSISSMTLTNQGAARKSFSSVLPTRLPPGGDSRDMSGGNNFVF